MKKLTANHARKILKYNPLTGELTWKKARANVKAGAPIRGINNYGYYRVSIDSRSYLAHRVAFLMMTGRWPIDQIDHINGIRNDNRWSNIREANNSLNGANRKLSLNNTSGSKGTYFNSGHNRWVAEIVINKKKRHLGNFQKFEDARRAYAIAAKEIFGDFARIV